MSTYYKLVGKHLTSYLEQNHFFTNRKIFFPATSWFFHVTHLLLKRWKKKIKIQNIESNNNKKGLVPILVQLNSKYRENWLDSLGTHTHTKDSFLTSPSPTQYCNCIACVGVCIFIFLSCFLLISYWKKRRNNEISHGKLTQIRKHVDCLNLKVKLPSL